MHVAIVGGGMAGLAAAWHLKGEGFNVTLFDCNPDLGGRCRTFMWNGQWVIRGAAAFITAEENLIEQARALGIYEPKRIKDMTEAHAFQIPQRGKVHTLKHFAVADILTSPLVPAKEKLGLARALPALISQMSRADGHNPESAVDLDTVSACAHFREYSPNFVDYILEPIMNMFCGYGEDDYSLAWLIWMMAGKYAWTQSWWSFAERGVGELTYEFENKLRATPNVTIEVNSTVHCVKKNGAFHLNVMNGAKQRDIQADAVVIAVPGALVGKIVDGLTAQQRAFFSDVRYVGHHIIYALTEGSKTPSSSHVILPTVEGYNTLSNASIGPTPDGRTWVYGEVKGAAAAALKNASDTEIIESAMGDVARYRPDMAGLRLLDSYVQRNDMALCSRHVGYTKALASFKKLPPSDRLAFAGDYLLNSTVGSSHYTGLKAAEQITEQLKGS